MTLVEKNKCWLEHPVWTVKTTSSSFLHASCWNRNIWIKKKSMPLGHPFSVSAGRPCLVLNSLRFARACPGVKRSQVLQGSTQTSHYSVEIPQNYRTFAACLIPAKWVAFNDPCSLGKPNFWAVLESRVFIKTLPGCKIGIPKKCPMK